MSELNKYLALINEFADKIESHLNKKYRPFLKKLFADNAQERSKAPGADKISLGEQAIVFKLGVEAKSTKCIEVALNYLLKLFSQGYIDLSAPNYCEDFVITEANIERKKVDKYQREIRNQVTKWLEPLIHFKSNEINGLVIKIYEYLIGEPILPSLLEISEVAANEQCYSLLLSYFNYRFYLFQECYCYKKQEIQQFKHVPANERLFDQIKNALQRQEAYENLISKYLGEVVARVSGEGGKYGFCVICDQPAQYFCKFTRASLCGIECKKTHLQIAQKEYKNYYESMYLFKSIKQSIRIYAKYLCQKQSPFLFSIMVSLMQKPYLFQLVKSDYKAQIRNLLPGVLSRAYESKNEKIIETLYFMISSMAKWWPSQCLAEIQFFIKEHILKVLRDKRPNFRLLILVFKSLDKIFEHGRSIVELYVNLDCQINQTDVIGNILFELSKIAQDKLTNSNNYSKQQKIMIKNSCMTLFMTFSRALNDFKRTYPQILNVKEIDIQKVKKTSLEKFVEKFNQHWSEGLKTLFNLNLVGLDSNHEIVNIIMSMAGLSKKMIDQMLFEKTCEQYLEIFLARLEEQDQPLVLKLLSFYKFIPMTTNDSIGIIKFVQAFDKIYKAPDLLGTVKKITSVLIKAETMQDFKAKIQEFMNGDIDYRYMYLRMLTARKVETIGKKQRVYTLCLSESYLVPLSSQVTLLQIPLSYMLETSYEAQKIVNLIKQLIPICIHSNWLSLLIKHSGVGSHSTQMITAYQIKIIKGVIDIASLQSDFIEDWLTILQFLSTLYYLLAQAQTQGQNPVQPQAQSSSNKKMATENKSILSEQLTSLAVENCLINASLNCEHNFSKFMRGVLTIAREQISNEQIMMLQKYFHMLDVNFAKYVAEFDPIHDQFRRFILDLKKASTETYIYIADMLKQLLLKLLKSSDLQDDIAVKHLQIFRCILDRNKENREVCDFVMNSLSTIVVYNYGLKTGAWRQIITTVDEQTINFPYQTGVIIRKVLNEHMKNIEDSSEVLLTICFKLIKPEEEKMAVEAIHDIKLILDLQKSALESKIENVNKTCSSNNEEIDKEEMKQAVNQNVFQDFEKEIATFKRILAMSINRLINLIGQNYSEAVAQTLFLLFSIKLQAQQQQCILLTQEQLSGLMSQIMNKLEQIELNNKQQTQVAERIMNQCLYWCVRNKNKGIVKNLQNVIVGKYTALSLTALKCIKTYIQMANLRDESEWQDVEESLLKIVESTQVERFFAKEDEMSIEETNDRIREYFTTNSINGLIDKASTEINVSAEAFIHECRVQKMAVELLPNHSKCLHPLEAVYDTKVKFNDNLVLRTALWKKEGIGREYPPDLLLLEETISNKIMAIHIWENNPDHLLQFTVRVLQKYLDSTCILQKLVCLQSQLKAPTAETQELLSIWRDYWHKRRQPLFKLISYIMPKLHKYSRTKQQRKELLKLFVKVLPIVDESANNAAASGSKQSVLKVITDLVGKQSENLRRASQDNEQLTNQAGIRSK